jgi:hypothetical protein
MTACKVSLWMMMGGRERSAQLTDFRIPTSGLYYLRATRFEHAHKEAEQGNFA